MINMIEQNSDSVEDLRSKGRWWKTCDQSVSDGGLEIEVSLTVDLGSNARW